MRGVGSVVCGVWCTIYIIMSSRVRVHSKCPSRMEDTGEKIDRRKQNLHNVFMVDTHSTYTERERASSDKGKHYL